MEGVQEFWGVELLVLPSPLQASLAVVAVVAVIYCLVGSLSLSLFANGCFEGCWMDLKVDFVRHLEKFVRVHFVNDCVAYEVVSDFQNFGSLVELQEAGQVAWWHSWLTVCHSV